MKVKELLENLSKLDPEDDVCALVFYKAMFDFAPDDEMTLTKEGWENLCQDFDATPFSDIFSSLMDGVLEYAEPVDVEE